MHSREPYTIYASIHFYKVSNLKFLNIDHCYLSQQSAFILSKEILDYYL